MIRIKQTIYGDPAAQKRPRFFRTPKGIRSYDEDKGNKNDLATLFREVASDKPYEVPLRLIVKAYFKRPKSHFRTGKYSHLLKENAPKYHTKKPDGDNLLKFIGDALNGVIWKDDSYIVQMGITKLYTEHDNPESRTIILIEEMT